MICDRCHKDREDVTQCEDPYDLEIDKDIVLRNLCNDCYQDRADAI